MDLFKDIGQHKVHPKDRAVRIFSLFTSSIVFALIIYVVLLLANIIPTKEKHEYERRLQRSRELLEILDISLTQAGFVKKATSAGRDIYMPQLVIRITNTSQSTFDQIVLESYFTREKQRICGGRSYANQLRPQESRLVTLKCVESTFTGAIIFGIGLQDAKNGLDYNLTLKTEQIQVTALEGSLEFNIL